MVAPERLARTDLRRLFVGVITPPRNESPMTMTVASAVLRSVSPEILCGHIWHPTDTTAMAMKFETPPRRFRPVARHPCVSEQIPDRSWACLSFALHRSHSTAGTKDALIIQNIEERRSLKHGEEEGTKLATRRIRLTVPEDSWGAFLGCHHPRSVFSQKKPSRGSGPDPQDHANSLPQSRAAPPKIYARPTPGYLTRASG